MPQSKRLEGEFILTLNHAMGLDWDILRSLFIKMSFDQYKSYHAHSHMHVFENYQWTQ